MMPFCFLKGALSQCERAPFDVLKGMVRNVTNP